VLIRKKYTIEELFSCSLCDIYHVKRFISSNKNMNVLNIAKYPLYLAQTEYRSENSVTTTDEMFASLDILKSFKDSYFSELHSYDTLEVDDEYEEMTDEERE
jgi:hypothetical protein